MTKPILRITQQLEHYFRVSTLVATAIEIGRIVGGLFSRDQRADRKETKRRQKDDATLLHRFKTQDADRARAAAALVSAARSRAETTAPAVDLSKKRGRTVVAGNEITHIGVRFWHLADISAGLAGSTITTLAAIGSSCAS